MERAPGGAPAPTIAAGGSRRGRHRPRPAASGVDRAARPAAGGAPRAGRPRARRAGQRAVAEERVRSTLARARRCGDHRGRSRDAVRGAPAAVHQLRRPGRRGDAAQRRARAGRGHGRALPGRIRGARPDLRGPRRPPPASRRPGRAHRRDRPLPPGDAAERRRAALLPAPARPRALGREGRVARLRLGPLVRRGAGLASGAAHVSRGGARLEPAADPGARRREAPEIPSRSRGCGGSSCSSIRASCASISTPASPPRAAGRSRSPTATCATRNPSRWRASNPIRCASRCAPRRPPPDRHPARRRRPNPRHRHPEAGIRGWNRPGRRSTAAISRASGVSSRSPRSSCWRCRGCGRERAAAIRAPRDSSASGPRCSPSRPSSIRWRSRAWVPRCCPSCCSAISAFSCSCSASRSPNARWWHVRAAAWTLGSCRRDCSIAPAACCGTAAGAGAVAHLRVCLRRAGCGGVHGHPGRRPPRSASCARCWRTWRSTTPSGGRRPHPGGRDRLGAAHHSEPALRVLRPGRLVLFFSPRYASTRAWSRPEVAQAARRRLRGADHRPRRRGAGRRWRSGCASRPAARPGAIGVRTRAGSSASTMEVSISPA